MQSHVIHKAVSATGFGLVGEAEAYVSYGPVATVNASNSNGLEFRVYDRTNTVFLGTIQDREMGEWTEELNGKGMGRLSARITDSLASNPALADDDNVIRVHYRNRDRFSWRVKAGDDDIIDSKEDSGRALSLDGPGGLDVLEEAIVFPEYSVLSEPTKTQSERYFGYMSRAEETHLEQSSPRYNLVTKPLLTSTSDWEVVEHPEAGTLSIETAQGPTPDYDALKFTWATSSADFVTLKHVGGTAPVVSAAQAVSMSVWVWSSIDTVMTPVLVFDTGVVFGTPSDIPHHTWTEIELTDVTALAGSSEVRLAVREDASYHPATTQSKFAWPSINIGSEALPYFDGDHPDSPYNLYNWEGTPNASRSRMRLLGNVLPNLQPSWWERQLWQRRPPKAVRKSNLDNGGSSFKGVAGFVDAVKTLKSDTTAKAAPDGWADPTAWVIWPTDPRDPSNPGIVYWRNEFYMPKDGRVFVQAAADNRFTLWLDGVEIIRVGENGDAIDITGSYDLSLKKGYHLIAVETENYPSPNPGDNYGWLLATVMYKINNLPISVVTHTDASWQMFYEGDTNVPYTDTVKTTKVTVPTEKKVPVKYTVKKGDTLIAIGKKFGVPWRNIYNANKAKIDARAAQSGLPNNGTGWWIFPGQVLTIPGKYTTTSSGAGTTKTKKTVTRKWTAGDALSTQQPGWYPYQILSQLISEAKAREVADMQNVTLGFDFGMDSSGQAWETGYDAVVIRSFRIGGSVYEAAQQLVEGGMDIRMAPDYTFNAYAQMGRYRGLNTDKRHQFVLLDRGGTTLTYKVSRRTDLRNYILIETDQGWREYSNLDSDETGRSEATASLGGVDPDKIAQAIGDELEDLGKKTKTVTTKFLVSPGRIPYEDFDLGDIVIAHDAFGRLYDVRITSMSVEEKENHLICEITASGEGL